MLTSAKGLLRWLVAPAPNGANNSFAFITKKTLGLSSASTARPPLLPTTHIPPLFNNNNARSLLSFQFSTRVPTSSGPAASTAPQKKQKKKKKLLQKRRVALQKKQKAKKKKEPMSEEARRQRIEYLHSILPTKPTLVRDFIFDSLYHPRYGYFTKRAAIYTNKNDASSTTLCNVDYTKMSGRREYVKFLQSLYDRGEDAWRTPSELFQPHYGNAIARYILEVYKETILNNDNNNNNNNSSNTTSSPPPPLRIFEIGGGNGTIALNVLNFIRDTEPEIYSTLRYEMIEISELMVRRQRERVERVHGDHVQVHHKSIFEWNQLVDQPCFLLAFELLDNLPHDKIVQFAGKTWELLVNTNATINTSNNDANNSNSGGSGDPTTTTTTTTTTKTKKPAMPTLYEDYQPVQDPLIARFLQLIGNQLYDSESDCAYVPTYSLRLLEQIRRYFPRSNLIFADFDHFPEKQHPEDPRDDIDYLKRPPRPRVHNEPIVHKTIRGRSYVSDSILVEPGTYDIYFPTDFAALEQLYERIVLNNNNSSNSHQCHHHYAAYAVETHVVKSRQFMEKYADHQHTRTKRGYNPLLQDYSNTSFFLTINHNIAK